MKTKKFKQKKTNTKSLITLAVLMLAVIGASYYIYSLRSSNNNKSTTESVPTKGETINYEPPTEEEQKSGDTKKEEIAKSQSETTTSSGNVVPIITDLGIYGTNVEVSGFIPSIVEGDGTCVINFKKATLNVSRTVKAVPDASSTHCTNVVVPVSEFTEKGTWSVTISYSSSKSKGSSETRNIDIQ